METQTKLRKKSFTIVEQAIAQVKGFGELYQDFDDKIRISGQSSSNGIKSQPYSVGESHE